MIVFQIHSVSRKIITNQVTRLLLEQ